jgi:polyferredoxin
MGRTGLLHIARRATQLAFIMLIFLMPVFDILRYDTASKELYILGNVWSLGLRENFFLDHSLQGAIHVTVQFFLRAVLPWLIVLSVFPLLGLLFGRTFCGWFCPEGALFELAEFLNLKITGSRNLFGRGAHSSHGDGKRRIIYMVSAGFILLILPPLTGIALTGYFVAPETIWYQIRTWQLSTGVKAGIIGISVYMFITSVFLRHTFCKYVCAAGLMQMLFGWISPFSLRVSFNRNGLSGCTDCRSCENVCFMGVKPRLALRDINCVNCGECIVACRSELGSNNGLLKFVFGASNNKKKGGS